MQTNLQIQLLGNPAVLVNGRILSGFVSAKAQALVYYLAATYQTHSRDRLAGLLWSEVEDERAKKNLRDVLSNLRQLLDPFLDITRQAVGWQETAEITIDSLTFAAQLAHIPRTLTTQSATTLRETIALYRGEFLAGFYVPDAPLFEEWVLGERERMRQLALQTLHTLAAYHAHQAEFTQGITYTTRLLVMDPWREEAHRQLMLLLATSGQRSAALAQYEKCCRVLAEELGVEPSAETVTLYEQIKIGKWIAAPTKTPPEPRSVGSPSPLLHNLPAALNPFIGREDELEAVISQLQKPECRLLTLVGPGGVGKTRLALQAAHTIVAGNLFPHGVYFVSLAATETAESPLSAFITALADALQLTLAGSDAPQTQLFNYLRPKNLLLVLDNFEQLMPSARFLVEMLQQAPALKLLITSRVRLQLSGEHLMSLEGLPFPPTLETADWQQYTAIQLFQQRARAVYPTFTPETADQAAIIHICQLVDGLPLGIELAASWVRLLSCAEIAHEIEQTLNFLQSSQRDVPQRHQSLRAVFDHSWQLLTEAERRVLRQLAVFRGGFGRDAAIQVTGASLPVLAALVDNSLARRANGRYELLELLRQYAAEKLTETLDETAVRDRHCHYYLAYVGQRWADLRGGRQMEALTEIYQEMENIRAAWRWAATQGYVEQIRQAMDALFLFYYMRSWSVEGEATFAQAVQKLADVESSQVVWARLLTCQGWFLSLLGQQSTAQTLLTQSVTLLKTRGTPQDLVFPLNFLAAVTSFLGDYTAAQQLCQEALVICRAIGDRYGVAIAKNILSQVMYTLGEYLEARRYCQESLAIEREIGNRWSMAFSLTNLGRVSHALGDYQEAQARFRESLTIREAMRDARGTAVCLNDLGDTAFAQADYAEAQRQYRASLHISQGIGNRWGISSALARLGDVALTAGDAPTARACFYQALQVAHESQAVPRMLDAMMGIATLITAENTLLACQLALLVQNHPAASRHSKDRAAALLKVVSAPSLVAAPEGVAELALSLLAQANPSYLLSGGN